MENKKKIFYDDNENEIVEGVYSNIHTGDIFYFTGNYNENGEPLFESTGKELINFPSIRSFRKLNKKELEEGIKKANKEISLLEKELMLFEE